MRTFFQNNKRLLALLGVVFILIAIPLTIYVVKRQQETRQRADFYADNQKDTCGFIAVTGSESPSCPRLATIQNGEPVPNTPGATNNISSYSTIYKMTNTDSNVHSVTYRTYSYFCQSPYGEKSPSPDVDYPVCLSSAPLVVDHTVNISPGQSIDIPVNGNFPNGQVCGTVQTDFAILSIDNNNSCTYKGPLNDVGASGYCETGIACQTANPSPTPTTPATTATPTTPPPPLAPSTPTPTRTPTPTPTKTPTPSPTLAPSVTPSPTLIAQVPSNTPTPTLTPTPVPNATATPIPTSTPRPNGIAGVQEATTPTPTLAPTGDGTSVALFGVGGMALLVIGALALFFL